MGARELQSWEKGLTMSFNALEKEMRTIMARGDCELDRMGR